MMSIDTQAKTRASSFQTLNKDVLRMRVEGAYATINTTIINLSEEITHYLETIWLRGQKAAVAIRFTLSHLT